MQKCTGPLNCCIEPMRLANANISSGIQTDVQRIVISSEARKVIFKMRSVGLPKTNQQLSM